MSAAAAGDPTAGAAPPAGHGGRRVLVLADTHLRADPRGRQADRRSPRRGLPPAVLDEAARADAIIHAGDVLDAGTLAALDAIAPTFAVLGNNDLSLVGILPPVRRVELGGVRVAMIHDSGPASGRAARLHRRFPDDAIVVFGHSHVPVDEEGEAGQRLFNPGSPTQRRAQPHHTYGILELEDGRILAHRIIPLD